MYGSSHTLGLTVECSHRGPKMTSETEAGAPGCRVGAKNGMADSTLVCFHPLQPTDEPAQRTGQMAAGRAGSQAIM